MEYTRETLLEMIRRKEDEQGYSLRKIATLSGISYDNMKDFKRGKAHMFRADKLQKLLKVLEDDTPAAALRVHREEETASIPVYDIKASAGNGMVIHEENIIYHLTFQMNFLHRVSNAPLEKLSVITVDGDSMEPTLSPEDTVLIDRTQTTPKKDGIYVLRYDDSLLVKRLRYDPQRRIVTIISDNDRYPPLDITDLDCLHVIGRVLWLGRRV